MTRRWGDRVNTGWSHTWRPAPPRRLPGSGATPSPEGWRDLREIGHPSPVLVPTLGWVHPTRETTPLRTQLQRRHCTELKPCTTGSQRTQPLGTAEQANSLSVIRPSGRFRDSELHGATRR